MSDGSDPRFVPKGTRLTRRCADCGDEFEFIVATRYPQFCATCNPPRERPMPASRECRTCGAPTPSARHAYCEAHGDAAKRPWRYSGAPQPRTHLGADHQRTRRKLLPDAIGTPCPICGGVMSRSDDLDLDHSIPMREDPTRRPGDRIVHRRCNRAWSAPPYRDDDDRTSRRRASERRRVRPSTDARGYGAAHRAERKKWKLRVDRGEVACARCGRQIIPGEAWDLDHDDTDRTQYLGPSHSKCNRATTRHRKEREKASRRRSRVW